MKNRKSKKVAPRLKRLGPKTRKEVWFEERTILSLVASCVEVVEGHETENDTEMVGLLYGKAYEPDQGPRANRYVVKRGYIIQNAQRENDSVDYDISLRPKLNSFYEQAFGEEYLGSFHLHPGGNSRLSKKDKTNKFQPGELKFLIFLKEKKLIKEGVISANGSGVQMITVDDDYYEWDINCKANLKRGNGKPAAYSLFFGMRGWYRYNTNKGAWYAPTSIMVS